MTIVSKETLLQIYKYKYSIADLVKPEHIYMLQGLRL